jgi:hypothetical protein
MAGKYVRGPQIKTADDALFCLLAGDHIYHDRAILPSVQIMCWPLNKIVAKVSEGKLFKAEFQGVL